MLIGSFLISFGILFWGAIVVLFGSALDMIDGTLARKTDSQSNFGAFLDSVVDRIEESSVLFGLFLYTVFDSCSLSSLRCDLLGAMVFLSLIVSLLVSYIRARSESLGVDCKEGIMTRPERVILLTVGVGVFSWISFVLFLILATIIFLGIVTIVQRIISTYEKLQN